MRRYGYTLQDVFNMPARLFLLTAELAAEAEKNELKQRYELQAFNAWQITEHIRGLFSQNAKSVPFNKYLIKIGLEEKKELTKEEAQRLKEEGIRIAEEIKRADKKRGGEALN